MIRASRYTQLITVVALTLALSAAWVTPALADDGAPPSSDAPLATSEEVAEPEAEVIDSDSAVSEAPDEEQAQPSVDAEGTEEAPVIQQEAEVQTPAEGDGASEPTSAQGADGEQESADEQLLAAVPQGTEVVVTGADGESLPLATEEAAAAILQGDPMWCPTGVTPNAGVGGCTASYTSFQSLLTFLTGNQPASNGVIWVEKSYDSGVNDPAATQFVLDGSTLTTMAAYTLTIQGGWDGPGTTTVDTSDPSEFNAKLFVQNWGADVTINDLLITGTTSADALHVDTSGRVYINRVRVESNDYGAAINNSSGTADVYVTLSQFNDNSSGDGLNVYSNGMITLQDVITNGNGAYGAYLYNAAAPVARNVVMTSGTFEFNDNGANGLTIVSKGAITLRDIVATGNGYAPATFGRGAILDNTAGVNKGITLLGTNVFSENDDGGLQVTSSGTIKANNLIADANPNGYGVVIDNTFASSAQPVILTGANEFKFNSTTGLQIASNGAVTTSNLTASNSAGNDGVSINNAFPGYSSPVTLNGTNEFLDNWNNGLEISSFGVIRVRDVSASGNGQSGSYGYGAFLSNSSASAPRPVIVTGTNNFFSNYSGGLYVNATGAITAGNVTASGNLIGDGAYFNNTFSGASTPQKVTLTGTNAFHGNDDYGLHVYSYGAMTLSNVSASNNGISGAFLDNNDGTKPQPVTLNGYGAFYNNGGSGLYVASLGQITTVNVIANDNGGYGADLLNNYTGAKGAVSVRGTSAFLNNGNAGLRVLSYGSIVVQDLDASDNGVAGAYLNNAYTDVTGGVTLGTGRANWCNGFMGNQNDGLEIFSNGTVTLSNICADGNGLGGSGRGVYVSNTGAAAPRPVIIRGTNRFNDNQDEGLYVSSKGAITASNLQANGSLSEEGVVLQNADDPAAPQNVTVTGSNDFHDNYYDGLIVYSYGNIRVNNVQASGNGWGGTSGYGVYLDNYLFAATLPRGITLTGESGLYDNYSGGLYATSLGAINLSRLDASGNNNYGAFLRNDYTGAKGAIVLSGYATFNDNVFYGLQAQSLGAITVTNLEASGNGSYGAALDNDNPGAVGALSLNGTNQFHNNAFYGLSADSLGAIKASNLNAWDNVSYGVDLDNSGGVGPVTLTGASSFGNNGDNGLTVTSAGVVTAKDLYAATNGYNGVSIDNQASGIDKPMNVTLNGSNGFYDNQYDGLQIYSYGQLTLSNLTANGNGQSGSGSGAILLNYPGGAATPKNVLLNGTNQFNDNSSAGLSVTSLGAIKLNRTTASNNGSTGVSLDNQFLTVASTVTISGYGTFENNGTAGLTVYSYGNITTTNLNANFNWLDGAYLNTYSASVGTRTVTLNGSNNFLANGQSGTSGTGLWVDSDGLIKGYNLNASWNYDHGAYLDNDNYGATLAGITLMGVNVFSGNGNVGLLFDSTGHAVFNNIVADANSSGVASYAASNVTISCGSMTGNSIYGWYLDTPDTVTLKGVFAFGNGTNGQLVGGGTLITKLSCP